LMRHLLANVRRPVDTREMGPVLEAFYLDAVEKERRAGHHRAAGQWPSG
jgi:hypothetical protein